MGKSVSADVVVTNVTSFRNANNITSGDVCNVSEITGCLLRIGDFFQSRPCMLQVIVCSFRPRTFNIQPT